MTEKQKFQTVRNCCLALLGTVLIVAWCLLGVYLIAKGIDRGFLFIAISLLIFMGPTAWGAVVVFTDAVVWFLEVESAIFPCRSDGINAIAFGLSAHAISKNRTVQRNEDDD